MPLMTMKEAIESSQEAVTFLGIHNQPRLANSVQLLILGAERIRRKRKDHWVLITPLLPGEAPE